MVAAAAYNITMEKHRRRNLFPLRENFFNDNKEVVQMNNDYVVFSKHLAKKLVKAGFVLKKKVPNKFSPEYKVYYF